MTWLPRLPPRLPLGTLPTPLVDAPRLRAELGCGPLRIKRDDLAGFGIAGNKTRPLEYLLGDAQAHGVDVLVTGGGPDSNFVAAAAMAARVAGIACELVVWGGASRGRPAPGPTPNLALAEAAGARLVPLGDDRRERVDVVVAERAAELRAAGRRPLAVPRGGSTPVGAAGFARAAAEVLDQCVRLDGAFPATVVLPLGSGGSTAGLLVGLAAAGADTTVLAVSVSRPPEEITPKVLDLGRACAAALGTAPPREDRLEVVDHRGPGFGRASAADRDAAATVLRTEGLLLDDTYGAKAFAVALARLRAGPVHEERPGPVVLWHTGGVASALTHLGETVPATTGAP
ncbi:1-aminocyclopropane-1-carboxylate deaminase/D-cysteine desulfhydrase [Actinomycetospora callitridis]|uniref:1-aminocyclopropane-1-carboxylate deaminase/D-cysteine desulfhydrase n=1 Tax=Actinomycetospora callitridis TaxID=913944 RepID=UPI0023670518|nr:pyridoxal-phosphate dependent enzyme [Actinomycetospora callitridis]MDD7919009.1 pyridoxal-phosphate dependent enzyme [Actinomycetospora callitridis]